jgi:hypothetical protein
MKARSLQAAVDFYLQSRRRLGFALKSEGALLQNLVRHAQRRHHRGPLTTELALDWARVPPARKVAAASPPLAGGAPLRTVLGRF